MNVGSNKPTDVESPRWTTVVHRVVVGATGATTVLATVDVVLVTVDAATVDAMVATVDAAPFDAMVGGASFGSGAADPLVAVATVVRIATSGAAGASVDSASSPWASGSALQPTTTATANASEATRRGRATPRV